MRLGRNDEANIPQGFLLVKYSLVILEVRKTIARR